jgi:hypothetical protein
VIVSLSASCRGRQPSWWGGAVAIGKDGLEDRGQSSISDPEQFDRTEAVHRWSEPGVGPQAGPDGLDSRGSGASGLTIPRHSGALEGIPGGLEAGASTYLKGNP